MLANGELPSKLPNLKVLVLAGIKKFIRKGGSVVMGESNEATFDPYGRRRPKLLSEEFPKSVTAVSDKGSPNWTELFQTFNIFPEAFLVDTKTRKPAAGVVYRTARTKAGIWTTAVNCSDKPIRAQWVDGQGRKMSFTDRLNLEPLAPASSLTMSPREVFLGTLQP